MVYEYIYSLAFNHRLKSGDEKSLKNHKNFCSGIRAVTYYLFTAIKRKESPKKLGKIKHYKFCCVFMKPIGTGFISLKIW